jgi:hypothetical protein
MSLVTGTTRAGEVAAAEAPLLDGRGAIFGTLAICVFYVGVRIYEQAFGQLYGLDSFAPESLLLVTITAAGWIAFRYWDLLFDPERWVDVLRMKGRARPTRIFVPAHVLGGGGLDSLLPLHEEFLRAYRAQK